MRPKKKKKPTNLIGLPGENHPNARLTEEDVLSIRRQYKEGEKAVVLAHYFGLSHSHVNNIISKRKWGHI